MAEPQPVSQLREPSFPRLFVAENFGPISSFVHENPGVYEAVLEAPKAFEAEAGMPPHRISLEIIPDPEGDITLMLLFDFSGPPEEAAEITRAINRNWTVHLPEKVGRRISLGVNFI